MKTIIKHTKKLPYTVYCNYSSPVPVWAKWVRNGALVIAGIGGCIVSSKLFPGLNTIAEYMVFSGNAIVIIVQGFKKSIKC